MQYVELSRKLPDQALFSLSDIRQIEPDFYRRRLNEWQKKGYIEKIVREYYVFSGRPMDEKVLFGISNRIYSPSYVSFETALAYYGLIPESIYQITCASTRKTMSFKTPLGVFTYHTIQPRYYFGFDFALISGSYFCRIASPEKALLDYFYLNPAIKNDDAFDSLRINKAEFHKKIKFKRLESYSGMYAGKGLKNRVAAFKEYIKHV